MTSKFKLILLSGLLIPMSPNVLVSCILPSTTNKPRKPASEPKDIFEIDKRPSFPSMPINNPLKQKKYNLTFDLVRTKEYSLSIPNYAKTLSFDDKRQEIRGAVELTWVLFSILYHHDLTENQKIKKLSEYISTITEYKVFLDKNQYLTKIIKQGKDFLEYEKYEWFKDFPYQGWYKLKEDYHSWLKNKFFKEYQYFSLSRIKDGDLSSLTKAEKDAIRFQSQGYLFFLHTQKNLIKSLPIFFEKIKHQINFLLSFASLNLVILENKDRFHTLEDLEDFLKGNNPFDDLKTKLKDIFLLQNNIFGQAEEKDKILNVYFSILMSSDTNQALFFNDVLMLMDVILNPLFSIESQDNFFKKELPKEYEYFSKYLYKQKEDNSGITFYQPSFLETQKENFQKITDYFSNYLKIKIKS